MRAESASRIGDSRSTLGLGGFAGAFCLERKNLEAKASLEGRHIPKELPFDDGPGPIWLARVKDVVPNVAGDEICDLQSCRIGRLRDKAWFKVEANLLVVVTIADAAKLKLQFAIFLFSAALDNNRSVHQIRTKLYQADLNSLKAMFKSDFVRIPGVRRSIREPLLVDNRRYGREGSSVD